MAFYFLKVLNISFVVFTVICLVTPAFEINEGSKSEVHIDQFKDFTKTQANRLDSIRPHCHSHKHSENGDEHDHNHEHSRSFQPTSKILYTAVFLKLHFLESSHKIDVAKNDLISDPHYIGIFRPPID